VTRQKALKDFTPTEMGIITAMGRALRPPPSSDTYILDEHRRVTVPLSNAEYSEFCASFKNRCVRLSKLKTGFTVSTVFLCVDMGGGMFFETMVFAGDSSQEHDCERYSTWDEAVRGHERMVRKWKKIPLPFR